MMKEEVNNFTVMNLTSHGMNHNFFPKKAAGTFAVQNRNYRCLSKVWSRTNSVICLLISIVDAFLPQE